MRKQNFIFSTFQKFFTLILLTGILSGTFHVAAQTKRAVTTTKKTAVVKAPTTPVKEEIADLDGLIPPDTSKTMSAAFKSGVLPAPAALPSGNIEEQAARLAEMVAAGDDNSTAALITAFKTAGYGLRDKEGNVSFNQENWMGIAIDQWQIAATSKLYGNGYGVGLGKFGDGLSILAPQWKKETNVQNLVESIRNASFSSNLSVRFWANFIIEMGKNAQVPFDLRNDEDVKHARLDAVQLSLILSRLSADVYYLSKNPTRRRAQIESPKQDYFINASYRNDLNVQKTTLATTNFAPGRAADDPVAPCTMSENDALTLDMQATGASIVYEEFLKLLEAKGDITKTPGQVLGAANAALILLKVIMTYSALEAEIKMDGRFLTKTKTTVDGERKMLTAKVKMDVGKWQMANCLRPFLNLAGLDFSLPSDGALTGVRVDWNLVEGGQTGSILEQINKSGTENSDALVYLDTTAFAQSEDKKKYYNYTDDKGESKIYAVGTRQKIDMSNQLLGSVMKRMAVNLDIQVKTMKIKTDVAVGTANDLAGSAFAFWNGDIPGFIAGTAAETLFRSNFGSSKTHVFPVKDWIPCDGGWRGTITYKKVFFVQNEVWRADDGTTKSLKINTDRDLYSAEISINPGSTPNDLKAVSKMKYARDIYTYTNLQRKAECRGSKGIRTLTYSTRIKTRAEGLDKNASADIYFSGGSAGFNFHLIDINGTSNRVDDSAEGGVCILGPPENRQQTTGVRIDGGNFSVTNIPINPNNPNELKGSRTVKDKEGRYTTITWNLSRCG